MNTLYSLDEYTMIYDCVLLLKDMMTLRVFSGYIHGHFCATANRVLLRSN